MVKVDNVKLAKTATRLISSPKKVGQAFKVENINLAKEGNAQSLRLYIYYKTQINKAYLQLFEYSDNQYEPCSKIYEYETTKIERLITSK